MKIGSIELPDAALNHHTAALGKTGSGKTYAIKGVVEKLLEAKKRVCVLDPTGAWWGLSSSADGKAAGFPVTIFGGPHGHVPINEHAGSALGELIGTSNFPAVIDLSETTLGERHRFVERFAEHLFRVNKQPLHLIIDEADEFAPQSGAPGTERMLGAIDRIVRRGRIKGFRVMLISQRPAVLNKNVLTQAETLIAMRLPSSQDRKAIELWIKGQADEDQAEAVMGSLASLQRGEGWIWSPACGVLSRVKFPKITTFDSSRTPEDGEEIAAPKKLADVDLTAVRAALAEAVKEAQENDPKHLREEIRVLRRNLEVATKSPQVAAPLNVDDLVSKARKEARGAFAPFVAQVNTSLQSVVSEIETALAALNSMHTLMTATPVVQRQSTKIQPAHAPAPHTGSKGGLHRSEYTSAQLRILDALAMWKSIGVERPTVEQVAFTARINPKGGHFSNTMGPLSTGNLVDRQDGVVSITNSGLEVAIQHERSPSLREYHGGIMVLLKTGAQKKILEAVIGNGGSDISVEDLGRICSIDPKGGHFSNSIGPLSTLGLIDRRSGVVSATSLLFPEGLS